MEIGLDWIWATWVLWRVHSGRKNKRRMRRTRRSTSRDEIPTNILMRMCSFDETWSEQFRIVIWGGQSGEIRTRVSYPGLNRNRNMSFWWKVIMILITDLGYTGYSKWFIIEIIKFTISDCFILLIKRFVYSYNFKIDVFFRIDRMIFNPSPWYDLYNNIVSFF